MRILILISLCLTIQIATAKQLAFSFDDGLDPSENPQAAQINHVILDTLSKHQVKAIVYPAINKIGEKKGVALIAEWGQQGHAIGNHSAAHLNLNKPEVALAQYIEGIQQAHDFFKPLKGFVPRYRFPFLKEGDTSEKRDGVRHWLAQQHYQSGAVSIDASDWYYNQLFLQYQKSNDLISLNKLKAAYITHLLQRAEYYDDLAQQTLHRSPKHVLLLHVRAINAAWLDDVMAAFERQGWQLISAESAYQDPFYQIQLNTLPAGESIIWSIAKVYGIKGLRYPAEDAPYEWEHLKRFGLNIDHE